MSRGASRTSPPRRAEVAAVLSAEYSSTFRKVLFRSPPCVHPFAVAACRAWRPPYVGSARLPLSHRSRMSWFQIFVPSRCDAGRKHGFASPGSPNSFQNGKKMNKYAENPSGRPAPGLLPVNKKRTSSGKKKAGPTKKHQNGKPSKQFFPPPPACFLRKKARTAFGIHVFCLPLPNGTAGTSIHGERPLGRNRVHRLRHRPTRTPDTNAPST